MKKIAPSPRGFVAFAVAALIFGAFLALALTADASAHYYDGCRERPCMKHVVKPHNEGLKAIHRCESRGDWFYNGSSGFDGGLQFHPQTWDGLQAGTGFRGYRYAYQAPIIVQKYGAVILAARNGWRWQIAATWPVCGAHYY